MKFLRGLSEVHRKLDSKHVIFFFNIRKCTLLCINRTFRIDKFNSQT